MLKGPDATNGDGSRRGCVISHGEGCSEAEDSECSDAECANDSVCTAGVAPMNDIRADKGLKN